MPCISGPKSSILAVMIDAFRPHSAAKWRVSDALVAYPDALQGMDAHVGAMLNGDAGDLVWLLEHPALYTAGTSAKEADLLAAAGPFPVYATGRGGKHTYHGPGQRVIYAMMDLNKQDQDLKTHVHRLEAWIIQTLAHFKVEGERRPGRIGIWVNHPNGEKKIAAIGVRARKWVTSHGLALNISPDLSHFSGIVPCGIREFGVTSLHDLGIHVSLPEVDAVFEKTFEPIFGFGIEK